MRLTISRAPEFGAIALSRRRVVGSACCLACESMVIWPTKSLAQSASTKSGEQSCIRLGTNTLALRKTTGNRDGDVALDQALKKIADKFGVSPQFGFYTEAGNPSAYVQLSTGSEGLVAVEENYFRKVMEYDASGVSFLAVVAHLFGHIVQQKSGKFIEIWGNLPFPRRVELHADYLAGFFLGSSRRKGDPGSFQASGDKFKQIGTYDPRNITYFGTASERAGALQQGFNAGYSEDRDIQFAVRAGVDYVVTR